ncbi:nuclear transport factor 2 family protein [Actinomadura fibrosa]|uniref:Nuclear transport factor 2 family protein n=1 Tax=Actinomadura fibrosa TaxID=111802 RepID=A0ABW2XLL0_9ACTN|nr:nuclear transport factor 2 family protein [Actinomadura fibrosa]
MAANTAPALSPTQVFERFRANVLAGKPGLTSELCADDVVVELPFARAGMPHRIAGREQVAAFTAAGREALPVTFDEFRTIALHQTTDPEVIVAQYEVTGTATATGHRATAPFVLVLRVRDGLVVHWCEYQDSTAIAQALAGDAH